MASRSSDFVLDEGLDDDEDMLAFHAARSVAQPVETPVAPTPPPPPPPPPAPPKETIRSPPPPSQTSPQSASNDTAEQKCAPVVVDGMPLDTSRSELDAFLGDMSKRIENIRLQRLKDHVRAIVLFDDDDAVCAALALDGKQFRQGVVVAVKLENDAERSVSSTDSPRTVNGVPLTMPDGQEIKDAFWWAFGSAKRAAVQLGQTAEQVGKDIDSKLHVTEKVGGMANSTRETLSKMDSELGVSEKVSKAAEVSKTKAEEALHVTRNTATEFDAQFGISRQISAVAGQVSNAARVVATEVDENLNLSERARQATNQALQNETVGPTVKALVDGWGQMVSPPPNAANSQQRSNRKKKDYQPSAPPPDDQPNPSVLEFAALEDENQLQDASRS